jgi:NADH dehydrogenase
MGRRFSGLLAWFMWRSVYLFKLPGLEKKVRVLLDWTLDLFFSRDIVLTVDTTMLAQQPEEKQDGSA